MRKRGDIVALFEHKGKEWDYEINVEGEDSILRINLEKYPKVPSIEDDPVCMANTCDLLIENPNVTKIVFSQKRDYEYDSLNTKLLVELALLYNHLSKQKNILSYNLHSPHANKSYYDARYARVKNLVVHQMKSDPIGSYVEIKRLLRLESINLEKMIDEGQRPFLEMYLKLLNYLVKELEKTKLITLSIPHLAGYHVGDRDIYRRLFAPTIKPDFMFTRLMATYPTDGEELDNYSVGNTEVTIFALPDSVQYLYHILPPEFRLDEDKYEILDMARKIMSEHKPKKSEFVDPKRMRQVFHNVGYDLIEELAQYRNMKLRSKEIKNLTEILVRYTIGFGLIEVLLEDEKIQDISINSPMGQTPMFIVHQDFDDCVTNIIPVSNEAESWATKLRMLSGRPLDEADPILDTEIELPKANARVAAITYPLDPTGLAFSFRRHRDKPWTLPLFMKAKMLSPLTAGLMSFLVDGTRTMLIAGTRSSGKSSLLSSLMVEIMRRYRIITVEDTLELPTNVLRKLGFNIQPLKVASALSHDTGEISASDGIRATLRLGDSALIVGEVRSKEAVALYEAMRVGAAANVVAGTIHGESPYSVFDRVVNDIGIPKTSFKATDIIISVNPVKSPDGIHKYRRIMQITEVRKKWTDDPLLEGGFVDLMKYDVKKDEITATKELIEGESEILKDVAGNIKDFAGNWDAVWENIQLRGEIKKQLVDASDKLGNTNMLEAGYVIKCNDIYHKVAEKVKAETGYIDPKRILYDWAEWFKRDIKKGNFNL